MKTIEIIAYKREAFGKTAAKRLREEGKLPCTLNRGSEVIQLYIDMVVAKDLIYTPNVYFIKLSLEGSHYTCIIRQQEFHPISDMPYHMKFMQVFDDKKIRMAIPIRPIGECPGIAKGGILVKKLRKLRIHALPKHMPDTIEVDISNLDLGKTLKVASLPQTNYSIQEDTGLPICSIDIPRSLRSKASEKAKEEA